jgi:hypothetical protein
MTGQRFSIDTNILVYSVDKAAGARHEKSPVLVDGLADCDCGGDLHLDFYDRTRLATWVSEYPGEILWLRERIGQPLAGWRPFGNWSRSPAGSDDGYLSDDSARLRDQTHPQDGPLPISKGLGRGARWNC